MGLFNKINEAKFSEGGVYVKPGVYLFEIIALKAIQTRAKDNAFVAEFKIVESNNPERMPGSVCSWMVMLKNEPAMGNIKQFLSCAINSDEPLAAVEAQIDEAAAEFVVSEKQPLAGNRVRCSATDITTKSNRPFTKCKFFRANDAAGAAKDAASAAA